MDTSIGITLLGIAIIITTLFGPSWLYQLEIRRLTKRLKGKKPVLKISLGVDDITSQALGLVLQRLRQIGVQVFELDTDEAGYLRNNIHYSSMFETAAGRADLVLVGTWTNLALFVPGQSLSPDPAKGWYAFEASFRDSYGTRIRVPSPKLDANTWRSQKRTVRLLSEHGLLFILCALNEVVL